MERKQDNVTSENFLGHIAQVHQVSVSKDE